MNPVSAKTRKRKSEEAVCSSLSEFQFDELNQDLLERVLSRLPASSFFRLRSVCRRWSSIETSATFRLACSQIPSRDPWFLMVGQDVDRSYTGFLMVGQDVDRSTVYDSSERNWKNLDRPRFLRQAQFSESIPVASSGGLVCFRAPSGKLVVCNPVTAACREIPPLSPSDGSQPLVAVAMNSSTEHASSYRIVLVLGELPNLEFRVFDSRKDRWEEEGSLRRATNDAGGDETDTVYFLSKAGDVVSTNMQRSPSKQYSSVLTVEAAGEEVVHFLSHSGTVVACDLARKAYEERPRLLQVFFEYSIDVVECDGEMLVVVLSEILETASLRVWRYSKGEKSWRQLAAMPPAMSHEFYGKKADINCVGCGGGSIMICLNSAEFSSCVMCNLVGNEWLELPKCFVNGRAQEFMSAFSFEPRVEASV